VIGASKKLPGVYGFSTDNAGVVGVSTNNLAGFFSGDVHVTGTLTATVKNAVVRFPDGSQRLLRCMESPEHWFEDFGSAKLARGRATVKLDADFAKTVKLNDYRVFLTPEGDCNGLYVQSKGARSFEVRELQGGKVAPASATASSASARTSQRTSGLPRSKQGYPRAFRGSACHAGARLDT
jgi:hypothetical protein